MGIRRMWKKWLNSESRRDVHKRSGDPVKSVEHTILKNYLLMIHFYYKKISLINLYLFLLLINCYTILFPTLINTSSLEPYKLFINFYSFINRIFSNRNC